MNNSIKQQTVQPKSKVAISYEGSRIGLPLVKPKSVLDVADYFDYSTICSATAIATFDLGHLYNIKILRYTINLVRTI